MATMPNFDDAATTPVHPGVRDVVVAGGYINHRSISTVLTRLSAL
jgi:hypothetical protein